MFWVITWVSILERASLASASCAALGLAAQAGCSSLACQDRRRSAESAM